MPISYQMGADMALVLKYGSADQSVVKGVNNLGLPSLERSVIEVEEFRNDFSRQFAGGGKQGSLTYSGNFVMGDTKGQDQLKAYLQSRAQFTDARAYINTTDFLMVDLANDDVSAWQVNKHSPDPAGKNSVISFNGEILLNGAVAYFLKHMTADTIAFADSNPDTVTDSASGFVTAGFEAGQTLIVEGSSSNNGQYLIESVTAGALTLRSIDALTIEIAGSDITLHGGKL